MMRMDFIDIQSRVDYNRITNQQKFKTAEITEF
jgi:hypothetical protein